MNRTSNQSHISTSSHEVSSSLKLSMVRFRSFPCRRVVVCKCKNAPSLLNLYCFCAFFEVFCHYSLLLCSLEYLYTRCLYHSYLSVLSSGTTENLIFYLISITRKIYERFDGLNIVNNQYRHHFRIYVQGKLKNQMCMDNINPKASKIYICKL